MKHDITDAHLLEGIPRANIIPEPDAEDTNRYPPARSSGEVLPLIHHQHLGTIPSSRHYWNSSLSPQIMGALKESWTNRSDLTRKWGERDSSGRPCDLRPYIAISFIRQKQRKLSQRSAEQRSP